MLKNFEEQYSRAEAEARQAEAAAAIKALHHHVGTEVTIIAFQVEIGSCIIWHEYDYHMTTWRWHRLVADASEVVVDY